DEPATHLLIFSKRLVGAIKQLPRVGVTRARTPPGRNQHRTRFSIASAFKSDHNRIPDFFLRAQWSFQILRIDVHSCRRDDDFFFSSLKEKIAFGVQRTEIAGAVPTLLSGNGHKFAAVP